MSLAAVAVLREPARYGSLVSALLKKDLKARYQAYGLGYVWSLLNPLLLMAVYAIVFTVILPVGTPAFPLFLASGFLPWLWFANSLGSGATSVVAGGSLVRRIYFPTQVLPIVTVLSHFVHFLLSLPILVVLAAIYDVPLRITWLGLLLVLPIQFLFTLGLTFLVAAWNVRFRDLEYLLANALNMWFFFTPIIYPPDLLPQGLRWLLVANPMALFARSYQDAIYHGRWPAVEPLLLALVFALGALWLGAEVFHRKRGAFAEHV